MRVAIQGELGCFSHEAAEKMLARAKVVPCARSAEVFDKLAAVGIDLPDVFVVLEKEGVEKFVESWTELLEETQKQLTSADK